MPTMSFPYAVLVLLAIILIFLYEAITRIVFPPGKFPKNIPTIPFYYTLIPLFKEVDQEELYRKYLQRPLTEHGAVKIFFGGHWNVLITRPAYMAEVLKRDEIYPKAGNHVKIPHSVLAQYTGENIISAAGDTWRRFASVMKPGLQADVDGTVIIRNIDRLIHNILKDQDSIGKVEIQDHIQAFALRNVIESLLGVDIKTLDEHDAHLTRLLREIKPKVFHPVHLNFPMLDHLHLPSREAAKRLVRGFNAEIARMVSQSHADGHCQSGSTNLGCRLVSALEQGVLSQHQFQQNCVITAIAGHENPQNFLLTSLFVLADNQEMMNTLREEIMKLSPDERLQPDKLATLPHLRSFMYETLRLYPPLSQIMNKRTASDTILGDHIHLKGGIYTGYNGYSTNRDREFWGPDADAFRPSRWGETIQEINLTYRKATSKAAFISFHGGKRACLGQKWALTSHQLTLSLLLTSVSWRLDPTWPRKMTPAGPLLPRNLRLQFERIQGRGPVSDGEAMKGDTELIDSLEET
ncbi:Dit2 protein [Xylariomycetidae sp. FL2044]|nr:Dit2 protein [Xylariomycetidae sp. FL2044]